MKYLFDLPIQPMPSQSVRFVRTGWGMQAYQPDKLKKWRALVGMLARSQMLPGTGASEGPMRVVRCEFVFAPLKSMSRGMVGRIMEGKLVYRIGRMDLADNLKKALYDALKGVVFVDDSQIVEERLTVKRFGPQAKIILEIEGLDESVERF
jgi:Holliday junction resolvase RusA-like endonuclease